MTSTKTYRSIPLDRPKMAELLERGAKDERISPELRQQNARAARLLRKVDAWQKRKAAERAAKA